MSKDNDLQESHSTNQQNSKSMKDKSITTQIEEITSSSQHISVSDEDIQINIVRQDKDLDSKNLGNTIEDKRLDEPYISSDTNLSECIINFNIATNKYSKQIEIEMIKAKEKRRKTSEDNGKETLPRIKNEQVLDGNNINNKLVKESLSKSHTGKDSMQTTTYQPQHQTFDPTLITDGQHTIISHERLTGKFIKQKHVSSRDNKNSKDVCNRQGYNLMNVSNAISTNNQKFIDT